MTPQQRLELRRALADIDSEAMAIRSRDRRRAIILAVIVVCCIVLAAWTGVLATTLPRYYRSGGWRGAWVGFDIALLAAFVVTGWAAWRRRQLLIICLVVLATLLCCDAWFDVVLDARTSDFWLSVASALVVELPLAALAVLTARRLLRRTSSVLLRFQGHAGAAPKLRHMQLVGTGAGQPLTDLLPGSGEVASAPDDDAARRPG